MKNKIRLIRHATLLLTINGLNILVDPMLSPKDAIDPVANASNTSRIPMADLPISESELKTMLNKLVAILITHLHRDHWDLQAQQLLDKT